MSGEVVDLLGAQLCFLLKLLAKLLGLAKDGGLRVLQAQQSGRAGGAGGGTRNEAIFEVLEAVLNLVHLSTDKDLADPLDLLRGVQTGVWHGVNRGKRPEIRASESM